MTLSLSDFLLSKLSDISDKGLVRYFNSFDRVGNAKVKIGENYFISFSCNDYFGLSRNEYVISEISDVIDKYGVGATASRAITGSNSIYKKLESKLSEFRNYESSLVFSSGYSAALGVIPAIVNREDLIISDRMVHACFIDASKLSGAKMLRFAHNSVDNCRKILSKHRKSFRNVLILIDHVYSMCGNIAPVKEYLSLAKEFDAWLMVDDAHGLGVVDMGCKPDIVMGTLSKSLGSIGGYVSSSSIVVKYLTTSCRSLLYSTALPPHSLQSALISLSLIKNVSPHPTVVTNMFCSKLGIALRKNNILSIEFDSISEVMKASKILFDAGFIVMPIRPPTVRRPCLRFSFTSLHTEEMIDDLVCVFNNNKLLKSAL